MRITCRSSVSVLLIGFLMVFAGCTAADRGNGDPDGGDGGPTLCVNPGDCQDDQKCLDGICRPLDYCETSEHCEEGFYCNQINSTCVEAECLNDSECNPGEYCDEGVCKLYCEGVQCGAGERCNPDDGQCEPLPCTVASVTCESDADCAPGLHCDPVASGCTECPPGFFCNIHECFPLQLECRDHSDCAVEERCNPDTNKCETYPDTCETDRDCTPKYCNLYTHTCQDDPFTGECETDEECHQAFGEDYYCHPRLKNCVLPLGDGECYDTPDCDDPNLVCDLKTNTCAPRGTVCGVDSDCLADHVCINGTCVYQCPPDKECVDDNDCEYGDVCRNSCCMEDQSCSSDWDCTYPEICEAGWCQEPLPCTHDDSYEDNDEPTTATAINFPALNQTEDHPSLVICRNDDDWYKIDVLAGDKLTVRIFFTHVSGGDLELKIYDDEASALSGISVDSSTSSSDNEEVEHTAVVDSTYYVQVYGYSNGENTYSMQIEHGEAGVSPCSPDDAYEENDAWTTATPITLPAVGNTDLYQDMVLCSDDEDWFAIEVPAGEGVTVRINFVDADGDLEMKLYDDTQTQVDSSTSGSANVEEVTFTRVSTTATYYVKVYGYYSADNDYTMEVENPGGVVIDCTDGGLEPNDTAQTATPVIAGEHTGLFICENPLDTDWYSFTVPAGGRLEASIAFDDDEGNLNLYLYESDGTTQVDSSTGYTDLETVFSPRVSASTTFLINVAASTLTWDTPYTLTVVEHPPIDCSDAGYEPNDEAAAATSIGVGDQTGMIICQTDPYDEDWYSVSILDGERMHFSIAFDHNQGNLNLYLYESDGTTQLDSSTVYDADTEQVDGPRARGDSTYLVRVMASTLDFDVTYDLSVTVDPPIQCTDDGYEPNDDFNQATPLSLPGIDNMIMCPGDADVFAINAVRTDRLNFLLVNESGLGDLDLFIFDDSGTEVGKSTSTGTGAEDYSYDVYVDGTYYVVVEPKSGDAEDIVDYHLDVSQETFVLCDTDAYEPNDNEAQATVLSDMQFTQSGSDWILELSGFTICNPGPFDWFAMDLLQGDMVSVEVLFTNADGDIDAHLLDSAGDTVDSGTTVSDNETVDFVDDGGVPADGRYYVRVKMYSSNNDSVYDIKVTADRAL